MTYAQLLSRLYGARRFGVKLELIRVQQALARLGDPHRRIGRVLHVGGTNGKGSTVAFSEALLREAGLRTAAFTSPHLNQFCERFRIDGAPVAEAALVRAGEAVAGAEGDEPLTFFEYVTAMAAVVFAEAGVDATVLEVGLGGRFDATNAIGGDVAAITGVAHDHQAQLGNALSDIAREKAGIVRPGRPAVLGVSGEADGLAWLRAEAARAGGRPVEIASPVPLSWSLGLFGSFQRANAGCALAAVRRLGVYLDDGVARRALAEAHCAGRMETVATDPITIVDGAHNPHAARAVAAELATLPGTLACVLGASAGKDIEGIVRPLAAIARQVFVTQSSSDRAAPAAQVADAVRRARSRTPLVVEPEPAAAIAAARASGVDRVLVAGSLFLVADARRSLLHLPVDPFDLADPLR